MFLKYAKEDTKHKCDDTSEPCRASDARQAFHGRASQLSGAQLSQSGAAKIGLAARGMCSTGVACARARVVRRLYINGVVNGIGEREQELRLAGT